MEIVAAFVKGPAAGHEVMVYKRAQVGLSVQTGLARRGHCQGVVLGRTGAGLTRGASAVAVWEVVSQSIGKERQLESNEDRSVLETCVCLSDGAMQARGSWLIQCWAASEHELAKACRSTGRDGHRRSRAREHNLRGCACEGER